MTDSYLIEKYLNENLDKFSPEEVRELVIKYQEVRDEIILDKIIGSLFKMIYRESYRFSIHSGKDIRHFDRSDLIQEGVIGVISAVENFDKNQDIKFSTYAYYFIKSYMYRYIELNKYDMTIPIHAIQLLKKVEEKIKDGDMTEKDIINYCNNKNTAAAIYNIASNRTVFLDELCSKDKDERDATKSNFISDGFDFVEDFCDKDYNKKIVQNAMGILTKKEKKIITLYYGLNGEEPMTFREIGESEGFSRQLANIIQKRALKKMIFYLNAHNKGVGGNERE